MQTIVGNFKNPRSRILTKNFIIVVILIILVVIALLLLHYSKSRQGSINQTEISQDQSVQTTYEQADTLSFQGKYDEGQKLLDEKITKVFSNSEKGALYESKALLAINKDHNQDALSFAKNAEELASTKTSATLAGISAERLGDKVQALFYYKLVIERIPPIERVVDPNNPSDYLYYLNKVKELGG